MPVTPAWAQQDARVGEDFRLGRTAPGARTVGGQEGARLTTSLDLEQTFSEMRSRPLLPNGLESVTRLSPGLRLSNRSGSVQGSLNYRGDYFVRNGRDDSSNEWQNTLDANFLAEAVPGFAYLDARAGIEQRAISAFGAPVDNGRLANANRTEVSTLWLSPYLTGVLAGAADYELRVIGSTSKSSAENTPDSRYGAGLASIGSEGRGPLGWRLSARRERVEYSDTQAASTTDRALLGLFWRPDVDLRLTVNGGYEAADLGGPVRVRYENYGVGFDWTPSPRTRVSATAEERYFGRAHSVQIEYRTAQNAFSYSDSRSVNEGGIDPFNLGQPTTLYGLLYQQFAAIQPDPALREQLVQDYIAATGRDPNETVYAGALVNGITVARRQFLGWVLGGRRTTLSLQAYRTETERIDPVATSTPGGSEVVVEKGYLASASHRLTPDTALSLFGSRRMVDATATRSGTDEKSASIALTTRLGLRTSGSIGLRYTVFNSAVEPYRETELTGRLRLEF